LAQAKARVGRAAISFAVAGLTTIIDRPTLVSAIRVLVATHTLITQAADAAFCMNDAGLRAWILRPEVGREEKEKSKAKGRAKKLAHAFFLSR
jgi:hypothetical protein